MYQVGEMIIYSGEGVCRVEAVGPIAMRGISNDKIYYTLSPLYREGKIYAPVDSKVFMRPVITREAAEALIRSIPDIQGDGYSERNLRLLNEHYQSLMGTHQCEDMVQVIKSAYSRRKSRHAQGSKPGQVDERYMKRAEDLLHGELAVALDMKKEDVSDYIAKTLAELTAN